jgi:ankyrin repeat protein
MALSASWAGSYESFFKAVRMDDARTVRELLARGFEPNAPDPDGQPALTLALREGSPQVVAALLAQPQILIDQVNASDETPLMMAALRGEIGWATQLLERGAQVNRPGWTPLHYAASGPEPTVLALLLDRGADIEAPSPNGTTPLMMAARYGAEESVKLLLARGANVRASNVRGLGVSDFARLGDRPWLLPLVEGAAR